MIIDEKKFYAFVDLLAESWRLNRFTKNLSHLPEEKLQKKILNQVSRFDKHFQTAAEELGLEVLDFTGAEFESGLPITQINLADFAANEKLFVEQCLNRR